MKKCVESQYVANVGRVYTVDDSLNTIEPPVFEVEGWEGEQAWAD